MGQTIGVLRRLQRWNLLTTQLALVCSLQLLAGPAWTEEIHRVGQLRRAQGAPSLLSEAVAFLPGPRDIHGWPAASGFGALSPASGAWEPPRSLPDPPSLPAGLADFGTPPWRLLSVPDEPSNVDPSVLLPTIASDFTLAYAYDACDSFSPWKVYDPNDLAASDLTAVDHRVGFWLEGTDPDPLAVPGTEPVVTSIQLCQGWNLIGYPAAQDRPVLTALWSILGKFLRVYGFDPTDEVEPWKVYDVGVPDWVNTLRVMERGNGYWIYAIEDTTLEIANDDGPPDVALHSPSDLTEVPEVYTLTDVVGTVTSKILDYWTLSYREFGGGGAWNEFARGMTPADEETIGIFDPTLLPNGLFEIRLQAFDFKGRGAETLTSVAVLGGQKVGHFVLPLLDMSVPILGVPFEVVRIYDSKDRELKDFGYGWRLHLSSYEVLENSSPGRNWQGTVIDGLIPTYCIEPAKPHLVVVKFPDGSAARFQPKVEPRCQPVAPQQVVTLTYVPLPGVRTELEPVDIKGVDLYVSGSFPGPIDLFELDTGLPHNPETYRVLTANGGQLQINELAGLQRVIDNNGNILDFDRDGITSSTGSSIHFERDNQGRIIRITDPAGEVMQYQYDNRGDLIRYSDRLGQEWTYTYQDDHFLDTIIDPNGQVRAAYSFDGEQRWSGYCEGDECVEFDYDLSLGREVMTDTSGNQVTLEYGPRGNVTKRVDGLGRVTTYEYDGFGSLLRQTNPDGGVLSQTFDERGNLTSRTTPHPADEPAASFTTTATYNSRSLPTRIDFPQGSSVVMTYDANGNLLRQEDEAGNVRIAFTYGAGGIVTSQATRFGTYTYGNHDARGYAGTTIDPFGVTTTRTFDDYGNLLTETDSFMASTRTYDAQNRLTKVAFNHGTEQTYVYGIDDFPLVTESSSGARKERLVDLAGRVKGWRVSGGRALDYTYDDRGMLATIAQPGATEHLTYDSVGNVAIRTDFRGGTETFEHDAMDRVTKFTDAEGHSVSRTFDVAGRVNSITNAHGETWTIDYELGKTTRTDPLGRQDVVEYDSHGLPIRWRKADGSTHEVSYLFNDLMAEADEYPTSVTDIGGHTRTFGYNAFGNQTSYSNHAGETYALTWDDRRQLLTSVTGPLGSSRSFDYNALGQLTKVTFEDGGELSMTYDGRGVVTHRTLPSGTRFDLQYDEAFRMAGWTTTAGESASLLWNPSGTLASTTDNSGTASYAYQGSDLQTIENSDGSTVTYGRDLLGQLTSVTVTKGAHSQTTSYAYDAVGNIVEVTDPRGGVTTMSYDVVNRLTQRVLPNGVTTDFTYNDLDQMIAVVHRTAGGMVLRSRTYERQGLGEPTRITREDGSYTVLDYDDARRIRRERFYDAQDALVETLDYTYDLAGNRLSRSTAGGVETYTYATGNRLAMVSGPDGTATYTHDADGRVVAIERGAGGGSDDVAFEYNSLDRLLAVRDGLGQSVVAFSYDVAGRRLGVTDASAARQITTAPVSQESLAQTHLVTETSGTVLASYAFVHEKPLMQDTPDGATYYLLDAKGSVIGLVDDSGQEVASFDYDSFGNLRSASGNGADLDPGRGGDYRFHGEWMDAETGLYYVRARYYDPTTGRFLSRDSLNVSEREPESLNAYVFAKSNPHLYSDPTGLFSISEVNVTNAVQNIMANIQIQLRKHALDEARQAAVDAVIDFLKQMITSHLGSGGALLEKLTLGEKFHDQGNFFQQTVANIFCSVANFVPGFKEIGKYLYFEVPMEKDGKATGNGLHCKPDGTAEFETGSNSKTNPDYIINWRKGGPEENKLFGTILLGDFKLQSSGVEDGSQLDTMVNHAKNYGMLTVLYIALWQGHGHKTTSSYEEPKPGLVQVYVLHLLGGRRPR